MTDTPDPIPQARESAVEVLRSLEWIWPTSVKTIKQCPCCYRWQSEGHAPDCRIAAALATPSGDDVAELRAEKERLKAENARLKADNLRFIRVNGELRERLTDCEKRISYQRRVLAGNLSGRRVALTPHQQGNGSP